MRRKSTLAAIAVVTGAMTIPALAEKCSICGHDGKSDKSDKSGVSQTESKQSTQSQNSRSQGQDQKARTSQSQQGNWKLEPTGWVTVGYDFDGDGTYDAVESVYGFDLEKAREKSQQRGHQGKTGGQGQASSRSDRMQQGQESRQSQQGMRSGQQQRISGEITDTRQVDMIGLQEPATLARLETDQGRTIPVVLGPKQRISQLGLSQGDRITVTGEPGLVNDRAVFVADKIKFEGRTVSVSLPQIDRLQRFQGTVIDTRTATHRRSGEKHLLGQVQLQSGRTAMVDLGPKQKVSDADLQHGDSITLLAKPGLINGRPGLKAVQFRSGGEVFDTGVASSLQRRQ